MNFCNVYHALKKDFINLEILVNPVSFLVKLALQLLLVLLVLLLIKEMGLLLANAGMESMI